ncbi:MAG: PstS family phosphate ABC transporter substrate-binding protein [Phycisphaeraceae bacterium]|nr:PstS family phosphate ABC transporter substrate-binding protein [Phycisphaeraceae bacterium]
MSGFKSLGGWCVLCLAAVLLIGCGKSESGSDSGLRGKISIDGSSTVFPITQAVAEDFGKVHSRVRVPVGVSGTGGGFKKFIAGKTDISDASRPIKAKERAAAKEAGIEFIELPVAYDGLSIVVNTKNDWCDQLTIDELKKIFLEGSPVRTWADVREDFPAEPIKIYIPGTDSGTFDYFKEVVAGKTGSIRTDVTASEQDHVLVKGVAGAKGGIGFFGCAYYFENTDKLKALKIDGGKGPVAPTAETIENGSYEPFSRPLFIYVSAKSADRPEVKAFVNYYLNEGIELVTEVGYVKLPKSIYELARKNFKEKKTGTHFLDDKGEKKSGSLTDLYK